VTLQTDMPTDPPSVFTSEFDPSAQRPLTSGASIVAITSGKGGVGKTFFSANLACALAKRGRRVLVIDADLGLANLDVVLNLHPKVTLNDVLADAATVQSAIVPALPNTAAGFSVILAGSGKAEFTQLTPMVRWRFSKVIDELAPHYDIILLDTGAGISEMVLFTVSLASEVLVVATPEPTSLTDAYSTIKVLVKEQQREHVQIVVNQTARVGDGRAITTQLQQVLDQFVVTAPGQVMRLTHLGDIPADPQVRQAVMRRQLILHTTPASPASLAVLQIATKLDETIASVRP
jgi:flagellar biosynthesis protein FlhG